MALKTIRIGSLDDAVQYDDADYDSAIESGEPIKAGTPVDPTDVVRLQDVGLTVGDVVGPAGATADNLAAFDGITGKKLKDSGLSTVNVGDAVTKKHDRLHTIRSASDHSDVSLAALANDDLMQWDDPSSKWEPKSIDEVAPFILKSDGTAGRVLKALQLNISDGTAANSISCVTASRFNGDIVGPTDNIVKGATTGNFTLSAGGSTLTIEAAGLSGNVIGILSISIVYNDSALLFTPYARVISNDIAIDAYDGAGAIVDLTTIAAGRFIYILIAYVTSA